MKTTTRNLIVENIGLAWVYSPPKARQYLNEALKGFAQHEREEAEGAERFLAAVQAEADPQPKQSGDQHFAGVRRLLAALQSRSYPVTRRKLCREAGLNGKTFGTYISILRNQGYQIECSREGRKTPVYQLMRKAG